jgi:hypothetical protein
MPDTLLAVIAPRRTAVAEVNPVCEAP